MSSSVALRAKITFSSRTKGLRILEVPMKNVTFNAGILDVIKDYRAPILPDISDFKQKGPN